MPEWTTPSTWLARTPLQANEQLFAVLGAASGAKPLAAWRASELQTRPQSIWAGTAYAEWNEVMPYVALIKPDSAFLNWVAITEATDWGWLAVSSSPLETVVAHLQGLTKVQLPDGQDVFLRFWDGAQFLPILQNLGGEAGALLPVFQRYLINGQPLEVLTAAVTAANASPWWQVPASLVEHMAEQSPQTLIDNLLQWLQEQRPDLYSAFTAATLRHKVAYFARRPSVTHEALADYLNSELS
ncbi:hypothetical protein AO262_28050 [Pseudomonas fluorescens ABAC62]|nr:hypothetical protein AO262_28050 [Pseudomonas fluorescens ABAC62]